MIFIISFILIPLLDPICEPSGITAAAPAFIVSSLSGSKYLVSDMTSIFIKFPHPFYVIFLLFLLLLNN